VELRRVPIGLGCDPMTSQGEAHAIEDRCFGCAHDAITARFVDRKGLVLVRRPPIACAPRGCGRALFEKRYASIGHSRRRAGSHVPTLVERNPCCTRRSVRARPEGRSGSRANGVARLRAGARGDARPRSRSGRARDRGSAARRARCFVQAWLERHLGGLRLEERRRGAFGALARARAGLGSVRAEEFAAVLSSLRPAIGARSRARGIRLGMEVVYSSACCRGARSPARAKNPHDGRSISSRSRPRTPLPAPLPPCRLAKHRAASFPLLWLRTAAVGPYALSPRRVRVARALCAARAIRFAFRWTSIRALESEAPANRRGRSASAGALSVR
jgi:hypothetical protein